MRIGFALLTLFPRRVGGSETYALGLLDEYAKGTHTDEIVVLANRHVMKAYSHYERGPVRLQPVPSYRAGDGSLTRALGNGPGRRQPAARGPGSACRIRSRPLRRDRPDPLDIGPVRSHPP